MSNSAQHPPQRPGEPASTLDKLRDTSTELLLISLSAVGGIGVLLLFTLSGLLTEDSWSAVIAGPLLLGAAGLNYYFLERVLGGAKRLEALRFGPDSGARAPVGMVEGLLVALIGVGAALAGSFVLAFIQDAWFASEVEEQATILDLVARRDPAELVLLGISAVILAPLTEEYLFRHMFFRRLYQRVGPTVAWTLPALAFALSHWNPVGLVIYVWLGSVFAMAYLYSGRLWVAMLVHAGHNAFALTMLLVAPQAPAL